MKNPFIHNPLVSAISNVRGVLDYDQKRRSIVMIALLLVNAILDFTGLATIGALIVSALENSIFEGASYIRPVGESNLQYFFNSNLRALYDWTGAGSDVAFLMFLSVVIFIVFLIKNGIGLWIGYVQTKFSYNVALRLNKKMFKHFYDQGYLFIKDSTSGKKVYSIVDIPMRFASHYLNTLLIFGTELVILFIIFLALLFIDPKACLLLAMTIIPTFYLIYSFTKEQSKKIGLERNELSPKNYAKVFESMNAYVDIKLSNKENQILDQYLSLQKKINSVDTLFFGIYHKLNQRTNDIIFGLGIMVIFGYAYFTGLDRVSILQLLGLFAAAAYKFLPSFNRILTCLLTLKNSTFVFNELAAIKDVKLSEFEVVEPLKFERSLKVENLSFQYPQGVDPVVKDISFELLKGETVGFIGSSGSGKSTLLRLLLGLIRGDNGKIYIDDLLVDDQSIATYQKIIGYVQQEVFILNDTVKSNIAFGEEEVDERKLWQSIKDAQLEDFITDHPKQVDLLLGENGVNLSGGQKQRIGIARALYKDAEILMFDEITSALDGETEKAVVETINHLTQLGKTVIIVAHRISTLEKCHRIYEISEGRIAGQYRYDEVIEMMKERKQEVALT